MNVLSSLLLAVPLGLNHVNLLPMHGGSMTSMLSSHSLKSLMSVHCLVEDQRTAVGGGGGVRHKTIHVLGFIFNYFGLFN